MRRSILHQFFLALSLLLAATLASARQPVVLVLGDSLSAAYGLQQTEGWVQLLANKLATQPKPLRVVNASISGDTTRGGLARLPAALAQHKPSVVIVALGGNDGLRGLSLDASRKNLDAIIAASKKAGAKPVIVGVELPPNYGPAFTARFRQMFKDAARTHRVPLVPSIMAGFGERRDMFQADGIHPTAAAQPAMLEEVWKVLRNLVNPA